LCFESENTAPKGSELETLAPWTLPLASLAPFYLNDETVLTQSLECLIETPGCWIESAIGALLHIFADSVSM
jgi:hypothetical protein